MKFRELWTILWISRITFWRVRGKLMDISGLGSFPEELHSYSTSYPQDFVNDVNN
jgi:hypothetical protein